MLTVNPRRLANSLIGLGVGLLFFPWGVRMASYLFDVLENVTVSHINVIGTVIVAFGAALYISTGQTQIRNIPKIYRTWFLLVTVWMSWIIILGLVKRYPWVVVVQETCAVILFLSGVIYGISSDEGRALDSIYPKGMFWIGVPIMTIGFYLAEDTSLWLLRKSFAYEASILLIPSTFFILCLDRIKSLYTKIYAWASVLAYTLSQVLFAKRAPILRIFAALWIGLVLMPSWLGKSRFRTSNLLLAGSVLIPILTVAVLNVEAFETSFERFRGFGAFVGATSSTYEESESEMFRLRELGIFIENMSLQEIIFGTGIGSFVVDPRLTGWEITVGPAGDTIEGKNVMHIGLSWSFYKGGLLFFLLFNIGIICILFRFRQFKRNPMAMNCWAFLLLMFLFSFVEGLSMQPGTELITFLVGACVGICLLNLGKKETRMAK